MRILCLVCVVLCVTSSTATAQGSQSAARVEVEGGGGYSIGGGREGHAPSLPTWTAGATVWVSRHVGVTGARVVGIGDDPMSPGPGEFGDRDYLAQTGLRFWRWSVRYRRGSGQWRIVTGLGVVHGRYAERYRLRPDDQVRESPLRWAGVLVELYGERSVTNHLSVRAGITYNGSTDTIVVHPQATLVLRF